MKRPTPLSLPIKTMRRSSRLSRTRVLLSIRAAIRAAALVLPLACSEHALRGGAGAGSGFGGNDDDLLFVPQGLSNTEQDGAEGGLTLVAFTLVQRADGAALYAA